MSAALVALEAEAERLRDRLETDRRSLVAHEKGALRTAREELTDQERFAAEKRARITSQEKALSEVNQAIHALRGTRPIADRPQA